MFLSAFLAETGYYDFDDAVQGSVAIAAERVQAVAATRARA